jgi:predicted ArsR family transcriptional regulator
MSELTYPKAPGFKVHGASEVAACAMADKAMQIPVLKELANHSGGATADEIAKALGLSILSIRPRVSQLRRLGKIEEIGARRKDESGMSATVWRLRPPAPEGGE